MRLHLTQLGMLSTAALLGSGSALAATTVVQVGGPGDYYTSAPLSFSPAQVTINAGDSITFVNEGGMHNVHSTSGPTPFHCSVDCVNNNAPSSNAWSDTVTFPTAGTINYQCDMHGVDGMTGSIVVNAVTPPPPSIVLGGYMSGNWYDSTEGGQGFQLELTNANNNMLAIWFVYSPDGASQNWIYSQGAFDPTSNTVTLQAIQLTGAKFPPNFNSSDVTQTPWGSLTFTFTDCNTGTASWVSSLPGYGSGSLPITRLTQIDGTTCPATQ
jgi:plastocyanin